MSDSNNSPKSSKSSFRVLCIGYDEMLSYTHRIILERDGFEVILALRFTDALTACAENNFGVAILGHVTPFSEKKELLSKVKEGSQALVILISNGDEQLLEPVDFVLESLIPPNSLLHTVRRAAQQHLLNQASEQYRDSTLPQF